MRFCVNLDGGERSWKLHPLYQPLKTGDCGRTGEQAGFTVEQMIQLLNDGLTIETLLDLISWRHQMPNPMTPASSSQSVVNRRPCAVN